MHSTEILDQLSEALLRDNRILTPAERDLLRALVERATDRPAGADALLPENLARALGEIMTQRALAVLGNSIAHRLMLDATPSSARRMGLGSQPPVPAPSPAPMSPQPPAPRPPGGIQAGTPVPPAPSPAPEPLSPVPRPPRPPGGIQVRDPHPVLTTERPDLLLARCVVLDEFLAPGEVNMLMQETLSREAEFQVSEVVSPGVTESVVDYERRRSRVLMDLGKTPGLLVDRICQCLPRVLPRLDHDIFPVSGVEAQITASNHGDFFSWHSDNDGSEAVAGREITFVYFFHREPKQFRGGELRIYDSRWQNGAYVPTRNHRVIVPQQNQLVIFPSLLAHEITPVECPSPAFADSRFTVNGWLHR